MLKKISFSKYSTYYECPWNFKLNYIDNVGIKKKNLFLSYGLSIHEAAEKKILNESVDEIEIFCTRYDAEVDGFSEKEKKDITPIEIANFRHQGMKIVPFIIPLIKNKFGNNVIGVEKEIIAPIDNNENILFEGFSDLVLENNGRIIIIDYKTSTAPWNQDKRKNNILKDQLCFYKHFYAKQHKIDESKIDSYFVVLAREAEKEEEKIEVVQTDISSENIKKSLTRLNFVIKNINDNFFYKSWEGCKFCQFNRTRYCRP